MALITEIAAWSVAVFGLLLFAAQMLTREIGYWLGRRHAARYDVQAEAVGVVVGAMLGLLAFVLALTLSFANTRFGERRAGTLGKANAIGSKRPFWALLPSACQNVLGRSGAGSFRTTSWIALTTTRRVPATAGSRF